MRIIRKSAYARAGLVGNPSDGYGGKTLACIVKNFSADVVLYDWPDVEIVPSPEEQTRFPTVQDLVHDVDLHGYYGGLRLVKASIKRFFEYCQQTERRLHDDTFSIRYKTNIPRSVGLAGSSAIIIATLRALQAFYDIDIPPHLLASLALSVETRELGISAGLQDRVIQAHEGLVFMDFAPERLTKLHDFEYGVYERLDPQMLPRLYIAYSDERAEPTEALHNPLRARFLSGDPQVVAAMKEFASLTDQAKDALLAGDGKTLGEIMDRNFDLRRSICRLPDKHEAMIEQARKVGASAKFAGSGGAVVGIYEDEAMFARLEEAMRQIECELIRPVVA